MSRVSSSPFYSYNQSYSNWLSSRFCTAGGNNNNNNNSTNLTSQSSISFSELNRNETSTTNTKSNKLGVIVGKQMQLLNLSEVKLNSYLFKIE